MDMEARYIPSNGICRPSIRQKPQNCPLVPLPAGSQAVAAVPSRANGSVEKITSTGTSKYAAVHSARCRLGLYSPRSR
jgi:hypothetical protein